MIVPRVALVVLLDRPDDRARDGPMDRARGRQQDATDIGYGKIIAIAKDADGSMIGLLQAA